MESSAYYWKLISYPPKLVVILTSDNERSDSQQRKDCKTNQDHQGFTENFLPLSTLSTVICNRITKDALRGTHASTPKHTKQKHTQSVNDERA